ncbi:S-adenosyl-L-methionine-dependent methyltransferase [Hymenopellis radicata]|nr:S-adenosyl-L-methionine-dependent methyltransferase [Hymenopellis radicata]
MNLTQHLAPDLCRRMEFDMASRPLLVEYGVSEFPADSDSDMESVYDDTGSSVRAPRSRAKKTTSKKTDDIPYATPTVEAICKTLFRHKFQVSQNSSERGVDDQVKRNRQKVKAHDSDPETLAWGAQVDVTAADGVYYRSVTIDGELYQPGDVVVVFPEKDVRPCSSKNIYAKTYWFCRICYFFEDKESKMFHAQWFDHSSRTLLQELGHSKALFLLQSCEDLKLATIVQKVHVDYIRDCDAKEPEDRTNVDADEEAISDEVNSSDFFCSYVHCPTEQSFLDLPTLAEEQALLRQVPAHHPCTACALKEQGNALGLISIITPGKAMVVFGEEYHPQDVVYLENPLSDLLDIAQIVSLPRRDSGDNDRATVEVRFLRRMDKKARLGLKEAYIAQDRHLRLSSRTKPALIKNIQGHCFVRNAAEMTNEELASWATSCPDHFYLQDDESAEDFGNCDECLQSHIDALEARQDLEKTLSPLRGMELFAGAGGLGTGMNLSNFVEAKWAVEFMPSAAKTYEANHPKTQVFCQDVGKLLKHAVDFEHTDKPGKLQSLLDGRVLSPLPRRGEVDILSGGPPCQAFSRANHCPNADDIRATLPMTMLSYVEFYAPKYFLLENVTGLLGYRLLGRPKAHGKSLEGGVEMGLPKLICRILMSLGYQVQFKVLQAGHYGAPQDRRRVIILGSRRGVPMPKFPEPTHAFGRMPRYNCPGVIADPTDEKKKRFLRIEPVTRSRNPEDITMCAPLRPITVNDAISDLAEFDWETPYHKLTRTPARLAVDRERRDLGIPAFCAVTKKKDHNDAVGYELVTYLTPPQTAYQKLMREAGLRKVSHHETSAYSVDVVEVSVNVPLEKGADYRGIPTALFTERFRKEKNKKNGVVLFGRLDANDSFKTAMTGVAPNASGSILLHPSQKRILTVREAARAQGFPDSYQFLSVAERKGRILKDQYKQIGNAVPIPLALALGRCIGEAEIKCLEAERKERDRSPSPSV